LLSMHADAFLDKPVAPAALLGNVRSLLASGALRVPADHAE
jgi:hypothetical protein